MYYPNSEDDDDNVFNVGMPQPGSNLQSLFGADNNLGGDENKSLMYIPPKQCKPKNEMIIPQNLQQQEQKQQQEKRQQQLQHLQQEQQTQSDGPSVMYACICLTFRHLNGQYVNQGKLGLAVLGNFATKDYKLLIYSSQKKAVTSSKVHPAFVFKVQNNNYASFYDDQSHKWSVCFESEEHLIEAAKRIAIAKFSITPITVVSQDLNYISGQEIQKGDTVEVQYAGWLLEGNHVGKCFDKGDGSIKLPKFKVGKGKVIKGWDLGILGMKKLSKRIIIIPPELATETKDIGPKIPLNYSLIFQIEITRVKYVNFIQDNDVPLLALSDLDKNNPDVHVSDVREVREETSTQDSLSIRTKLSMQSLKPELPKTKNLECVPKIALPMVSPPVSNVSLEDEEKPPAEGAPENMKPLLSPDSLCTSTLSLPVVPPSDKIHVPVSQPAQQNNLNLQQPMIDPNSIYRAQHQQQQQQQQQQTQQHQQHQQQLALYSSPQLLGYPSVPQITLPQVNPQPATLSTTEMNLILTDGRLKHTEVKADLNRIVDKMDVMSSKISNLENTNKQLQISQAATTSQQQMSKQGQEMEAVVIMQNITRILRENEKLRRETVEKTKKIELLNERMTDLLTKNQQFFEKSNQLLVNKSDSMQTSATQAMIKVSQLEDQNIILQNELAELRSQLLKTHAHKENTSKNDVHVSNKNDAFTQERKEAKEIDTFTQEHIQVKEHADVSSSLDWGGPQNFSYYDPMKRDPSFLHYQLGDIRMPHFSHKKSKSWRGWSKEEEIILRKAFKEHYDSRVVPLYPDIVNAINTYPLLAARGKRNIKDKVRNDILRLQRTDEGPSYKMMKRNEEDGPSYMKRDEEFRSPFNYTNKGDSRELPFCYENSRNGGCPVTRDEEEAMQFNVVDRCESQESTVSSKKRRDDQRSPSSITINVNNNISSPNREEGEDLQFSSVSMDDDQSSIDRNERTISQFSRLQRNDDEDLMSDHEGRDTEQRLPFISINKTTENINQSISNNENRSDEQMPSFNSVSRNNFQGSIFGFNKKHRSLMFKDRNAHQESMFNSESQDKNDTPFTFLTGSEHDVPILKVEEQSD